MDIIQAIAAFGGFILGIVNLLILLYQEFLKKGKIKASIENAIMRKTGVGFYDLQISAILSASRGDVFLREIKLINESTVLGPYAAENSIILNRIYPYIRENLLRLNPEEFEQKIVQEMNPNSILVRDLKIANNSQKSYTILDRIESARFPDGWDELPLNGWSLQIECNSSQATIPVIFQR